jgi:hypothetical protein
MNALQTLQDAGLTVTVKDGKLKLGPAALLTDAWRELARTHKGEILAALGYRMVQRIRSQGHFWDIPLHGDAPLDIGDGVLVGAPYAQQVETGAAVQEQVAA